MNNNNMLFAPKESGQGLLLFAILLGILALVIVTILKRVAHQDGVNCGALEFSC